MIVFLFNWLLIHTIDSLQNRKVCVLCNLKPASMRGIKSQAMVLAASNDDHSKVKKNTISMPLPPDSIHWGVGGINIWLLCFLQVELVEPPSSAKVGERITFPGSEGNPDELLNPKKKVWETLQVDLHTNEDLVACYKNVPLTTSAGICKVSSIRGGSIK